MPMFSVEVFPPWLSLTFALTVPEILGRGLRVYLRQVNVAVLIGLQFNSKSSSLQRTGFPIAFSHPFSPLTPLPQQSLQDIGAIFLHPFDSRGNRHTGRVSGLSRLLHHANSNTGTQGLSSFLLKLLQSRQDIALAPKLW